eukprot:CAMPEP_0182588802 /NCGR_PEP_ID=MMETSP1324-20130603/68054_1 /TAXON_ID=236786 /ORGANISM="Florenciella sp., Strain RCC1587" /LENGTH=66 /DNA_ID=CAMNT_0024805907 /DNA_START=129 /DNA_END=326 /DNA_ORIENTATION=-
MTAFHSGSSGSSIITCCASTYSANSDRVNSSVGPPAVQMTGVPTAAASSTGKLKPSALYADTYVSA